MSEINAYCCEYCGNMQYPPSTPNFAQVNFIPSLSSLSGPLYLHSWTLQVQQHFPEVQLFAEPLEPQALAVCAGGIPKPGFTGTSPLLPASSCTGKTQGSFFLFHSPSGAGRTPKGREATRGIGVGKQLSFSTLEKRICGPQGWIWCWEGVQGISAHLATVC